MRKVRLSAAYAGILGGLLLSLAGCASERPAKSGPKFDQLIEWAPVAGAMRYGVRAWSGYHLILEESTADTLLTLQPAWLMAMASFDTVLIEVRAYGPNGGRVGDVWRQPWSGRRDPG